MVTRSRHAEVLHLNRVAAIADIFRDSGAGSGMTDGLQLTDDEVADFRRIVSFIYERYFGAPVPAEYR